MLIYASWEYIWYYLTCPGYRIPRNIEQNVISEDLNTVEVSRLLNVYER